MTREQMWDFLFNGKDIFKIEDGGEILYTEEAASQANALYRWFKTRYYNIHKIQSSEKRVKTDKKEKETLVSKQAEYDLELQILAESTIKRLKAYVEKYGVGVRDLFTLYVLSGIDEMQNIKQHPQVRSLVNRDTKDPNVWLLSKDVYNRWMKLWKNILKMFQQM